MSGLAELLGGRVTAGVYRWDGTLPVREAMRTAEVAGWSFAHVDGALVLTKRDALAAFAAALDVEVDPAGNLDALWDRLRDVPGPTLVLWDRWDVLAEADPIVAISLIGLLGDRAADGGLALLLRGEGPDFEIPVLPG
jgi:hypothetical protein